ncbi:MAG: aldehyde dehydrogenase family protein [Rhodospirillales bacterium]|jgi:1-pyrroline-5-carboxylate dehydrogenase|nr:aldehyde dehydrogenase family protein [Rhodospirillales bacterium]
MAKKSALPRVTYTNIQADFTPLHDMLDAAIPAFRSGLGKSRANLVGGRDDDDGTAYEALSPIDRSLALGTFVAASQDAVERAAAAAAKAFLAWSAVPWRERVAVMRRLAEILDSRKYDLGIAALLEVGKSRMEAIGEAEEAVDLVSYYCDEMERNEGFARPLNRAFEYEETRDVLRPVGVFGVIAPFNYPVALPVNMMVGALITGNTVVYKPSPGAGLTGAMLVDALVEAGLPEGAVNLVCGEAAGAYLVDEPAIGGIAFTGSYAVGMEIYRKLAAGPYARPMVVEMGGKNPAYVTASADLDVAADGVMRSAFGLQGEKCSACSVAYVETPVLEPFVELLAERTGKLKVGTPEDRDVFVGPVIDAGAHARFEGAVKESRAQGRVVTGGARLEGGVHDGGYYLAPTVVADLPADHRLHGEELFLPFIAVTAFDDLNAALERGNRVVYGLTAGIFAEREDELALFFDKAQAGVLYANRRSGATTGAWPGIQTFCGWKGSGVSGKGGLGPYYLPQFMREQSHTIMRRPTDGNGDERRK